MAQPSVVQSAGSTGGNITITPPAGTNLGLLIYSEGRSNGGLTSPTWNGNNMTLLVSENGNAGSGGVEIYGYLNPATGSSITVTPNAPGVSYDRATAICVASVDTSVALASYTTYQADGTGDAGAADISQSVGTIAPYELVIDGEGHFRTTVPSATGTDQTEIEANSNYGRSYQTGDGATTSVWNLNYGTSNAWGWAAVVVPGVGDTTVDIPLGELTITGYAPTVSPLNIDIPLGELTITGYAPIVDTAGFPIIIPAGSLVITGYAPLIGDEELLIRTADGGTLLGRLTDGTGVALFSDGENWYALALPKQGT